MPLGRAKEPKFAVDHLPDRQALVEPLRRRSGRDRRRIGWYDVFARWKLAIVLEGSYAKYQRGRSDNPVHEFFGPQVDLLLDSATRILEPKGCCDVQPMSSSGADRLSRPTEERLMRAWQVQDKGEPVEVLRPVTLDQPQPGPGQTPHSGDGGGHRAARRVHVPAHLPAHAAAALHTRTGGTGSGHRDRRRGGPCRSATGSWR